MRGSGDPLAKVYSRDFYPFSFVGFAHSFMLLVVIPTDQMLLKKGSYVRITLYLSVSKTEIQSIYRPIRHFEKVRSSRLLHHASYSMRLWETEACHIRRARLSLNEIISWKQLHGTDTTLFYIHQYKPTVHDRRRVVVGTPVAVRGCRC